MFTVAVVGPDGAGKTTVCRELERRLTVPCKYVYMGHNPDMGSPMLPTTRFLFRLRKGLRGNAGPSTSGGPAPEHGRENGRTTLVSAARTMKSVLRSFVGLSLRICEEWFRQEYARRYRRRGFVVVYDRHFLTDYWANAPVDGGRRSFVNKLHGRILEWTLSRPDLVIYLDAPAELLFARKREGTPDSLELQRQGFLRIGSRVDAYRIVDGALPLDQVVDLTLSAVTEYLERCNNLLEKKPRFAKKLKNAV